MKNALIDLMDDLFIGRADGSAYAGVSRYFRSIGFQFVNAGYFSRTSGEVFGFQSDMDPGWMEEYVACAYASADPWVANCQRIEGVHLFTPDRIRAEKTSDRDRTAACIAAAKAQGVVSSLTAGRSSPVSDRAIGFGLHIDRDGDVLERMVRPRQDEITLAVAVSQIALLEDFEGQTHGPYWYDFASGPKLTARELEVLKWLTLGLRNDAIADRLGLASATVNYHIASAKTKLGARTREQAVAIALRRGLL